MKVKLFMRVSVILFVALLIFHLVIDRNYAYSQTNSTSVYGSEPNDEKTIKNFTYSLKYSNQSITLIDGEYKTSFNIKNEKDLKNHLSVKLEKYCLINAYIDEFLSPAAIVLLSENFGESGSFTQINALVRENDKIVQTNSIEIGNSVVVENIRIELDMIPFRKRDHMYLSILTHKKNDPSCCPTLKETLCFTFIRDTNNKIRLMKCEEAEILYHLPVVKKPAIYLYPKKTQSIEVTLKPKGYITTTTPEYNEKCLVTVNPDGLIDSKYPYLFYDVTLKNSLKLPKEGWIVKKEDLEKWFTTYLPKLGLIQREIKDFKKYWLNNLKDDPYYVIKFLSPTAIKENLGVKITPEPDIFIRLIFYIERKANKDIKLKEPKTKTPTRKGVTVVDWGGILAGLDKSDLKNKE